MNNAVLLPMLEPDDPGIPPDTSEKLHRRAVERADKIHGERLEKERRNGYSR